MMTDNHEFDVVIITDCRQKETDNVEIKELEISGRTHHRDKTCEEIKLKMMSVLISVAGHSWVSGVAQIISGAIICVVQSIEERSACLIPGYS